MTDTLDNPQEFPFPDAAHELLAMPSVLSAVALSTDTPGGWCPFATRISTPNFWKGNLGRAGVVDHVTDAAAASVISWFKNPASERSAHFQVRRNGQIDQFVSVEDSAWANGATWAGNRWVDPQGQTINPTWIVMQHNHANPNRITISVEHEGTPAQEWTAAQKAADTRLDRWLAEQFPSLSPYIAHVNLIGHYAISPRSKPNCPGPRVDLVERARAANGASPPPTDPLATHSLPGPVKPMKCGEGFYNLYYGIGPDSKPGDDRGFPFFGYALTDEAAGVGQDGRNCTWMRWERAIAKHVAGKVELALLGEAKALGWL